MKIKIIFTVVLFSLLLNIFHDFTIPSQITSDCCTKIELLDKSDDCYKIEVLHHFFHFFALALTLEDELFLRSQIKPVFDIEHPPLMVRQTSFKPPRT
jgi:hypothetical protein